jgi:hypothetical protein
LIWINGGGLKRRSPPSKETKNIKRDRKIDLVVSEKPDWRDLCGEIARWSGFR